MILIDGKDKVFAFDRDNNPFLIKSVAFVKRQKNPVPISLEIAEEEYIRDTLVDAEVVIDKVNEPGDGEKDVPRILIYDLITLQVFPWLIQQLKIGFRVLISVRKCLMSVLN